MYVNSSFLKWLQNAILVVAIAAISGPGFTESAPVSPAVAGDESSVQSSSASPGENFQSSIPRIFKRAFFGHEKTSQDARHIADWVVDSDDNRGMPFIIVDKKEAKIFVFDTNGRIRGAAPALLGLALGDDSTPGIGERELSDIAPQDRITPAGRFVAAIGRSARGEDVVWVDYDTAVSLHRVITSNPREHRLERLASATPLDNRISYGCINVPAQFYNTVVSPAFSLMGGIVYVLPEMRPAREVFKSYDVEEMAAHTARATRDSNDRARPASFKR